jgi:hypothetical protein
MRRGSCDVDAESNYAEGEDRTGTGSRVSRSVPHGGFLGEAWLTPIQIAHKFGYVTDKPIRKAIMRGELKAARAPCRRKLVVAESEVLRWIDGHLAYKPAAVAEDPSATVVRCPSPRSPRRTMPTLSYEAERGNGA